MGTREAGEKEGGCDSPSGALSRSPFPPSPQPQACIPCDSLHRGVTSSVELSVGEVFLLRFMWTSDL